MWRNDGAAALVIGGSIALSLVTACGLALGVASLLHRFELDPKIAAGPITLALADFFCAGDLFHRRVAGFAMSSISVIIPALDEEEPIAGVVRECFATGLPNEVIVVDNDSTDRTAERAREAGAQAVTAPRG